MISEQACDGGKKMPSPELTKRNLHQYCRRGLCRQFSIRPPRLVLDSQEQTDGISTGNKSRSGSAREEERDRKRRNKTRGRTGGGGTKRRHGKNITNHEKERARRLSRKSQPPSPFAFVASLGLWYSSTQPHPVSSFLFLSFFCLVSSIILTGAQQVASSQQK